ncbi:MAG: PQQ-dependent sugar dehydrogenase [Pyrinomonadaceae bacterium]
MIKPIEFRKSQYARRLGMITTTGFLLVSLLILPVLAQPKLSPQRIERADGKVFNLNLPADYEIIPAAEGMKRVRFFAKAPDGRIFVTDMFNLTDNEKGKVYILDQLDNETGKFGKVSTYMSGLKNPNSVAFYTDETGQSWFYLAETDKLTRRRFTSGEIEPTDVSPETLATFPAYGLSYKYGGWHLTRTVVIGGNGKLYISVGSSCNACREKQSEPTRATVVEMDPDGSNQRIFARGLRNAVGMLWLGNHLFATVQGADHLGTNKPDDTFHAIREGKDYGWPKCYEYRRRIFRDRFITGGGNCRGIPVTYSAFPAHSSAMGFDYFDSETSDEKIRDSFLIALHGSTDKSLKKGYRVVIVRKGLPHEDFITGFLENKTVHGRPLDIFKLTPDSFLLSDDHDGVIYLVRRKPV